MELQMMILFHVSYHLHVDDSVCLLCLASAATTRSVYEKKLYVLLGGHLPDSPTFNGDVEQEDEEEYSDSEPGEWLPPR